MSHPSHYPTSLRDNYTFSPFSLHSSPHYHSHPYLVPARVSSFRKPLLPDPIPSDIDRHRAYSEGSNSACQRAHYPAPRRDNVTSAPFFLPSSPQYHSHSYPLPDRFPSFRKPLLPDPISSDIDRYRAYSDLCHTECFVYFRYCLIDVAMGTPVGTDSWSEARTIEK